VLWTTQGDGVFSANWQAVSSYLPGTSGLLSGNVELALQGINTAVNCPQNAYTLL